MPEKITRRPHQTQFTDLCYQIYRARYVGRARVRAAARQHGLETLLTGRMLALIAQIKHGKSE